jgi:hypothetical protein
MGGPGRFYSRQPWKGRRNRKAADSAEGCETKDLALRFKAVMKGFKLLKLVRKVRW